MSIAIRDVREHELDSVLALNNAAGPGILPLDAARVRQFYDEAEYFRVAERDGALAAYAYAGPFHTRSAYRFTVENSVYVAKERAREGIGTLIMRRLIRECEARGMRQMIARIGDSDNAASIRLHRKLGFRRVGELSQVGFKFGRWWDVVEMARLLEPRLQ